MWQFVSKQHSFGLWYWVFQFVGLQGWNKVYVWFCPSYCIVFIFEFKVLEVKSAEISSLSLTLSHTHTYKNAHTNECYDRFWSEILCNLKHILNIPSSCFPKLSFDIDNNHVHGTKAKSLHLKVIKTSPEIKGFSWFCCSSLFVFAHKL